MREGAQLCKGRGRQGRIRGDSGSHRNHNRRRPPGARHRRLDIAVAGSGRLLLPSRRGLLLCQPSHGEEVLAVHEADHDGVGQARQHAGPQRGAQRHLKEQNGDNHGHPADADAVKHQVLGGGHEVVNVAGVCEGPGWWGQQAQQGGGLASSQRGCMHPLRPCWVGAAHQQTPVQSQL